MFPEPRSDTHSATYGPVNGHRFNQFTPWQMNEDGTDEETLNHMGRHELSFGYLIKSFASDPKLSDYSVDSLHANTFSVGMDTGLFQLREDPVQPALLRGVHARVRHARLGTDLPHQRRAAVNPDAMALTARTGTRGHHGGRYRNPLPLANGELVSEPHAGLRPHAGADDGLPPEAAHAERGHRLLRGRHAAHLRHREVGDVVVAGYAAVLHGALWEIEAVEVVARTRPSRPALPLEAPERDVFAETGV
jgi:hypothetical protein